MDFGMSEDEVIYTNNHMEIHQYKYLKRSNSRVRTTRFLAWSLIAFMVYGNAVDEWGNWLVLLQFFVFVNIGALIGFNFAKRDSSSLFRKKIKVLSDDVAETEIKRIHEFMKDMKDYHDVPLINKFTGEKAVAMRCYRYFVCQRENKKGKHKYFTAPTDFLKDGWTIREKEDEATNVQ